MPTGRLRACKTSFERFPKYLVFFQNSIFRKKWALYEEMRARFRKKQHICFNFVKLGDESQSI